jgi:hypothetical protein
MKEESLTYILLGNYFDNESSKIYIESCKASRKTQILVRNNIIYYCIDDDNIPSKEVRGKGTVRISEDINYNLPIAEKIVVKRVGRPVSQLLLNSLRNGDAVLLEITPRFFASWDDGKVK